MTYSTVSSMLFLLLLVFSFHMDEAIGAQTENRKLKETMTMRRNLKGNGDGGSKIYATGSASPHAGSKTTQQPQNQPAQNRPAKTNYATYEAVKNRNCASYNRCKRGN